MHRQLMEILMIWLLNSSASLSILTGGYSAATLFKLPGIFFNKHSISSQNQREVEV